MVTSLQQETQQETQQELGPTFDWVTLPGLIAHTNNQVSESQLRWWLRSKSTNGLAKCVRLRGRKMYFNKQLFNAWFEKEVV